MCVCVRCASPRTLLRSRAPNILGLGAPLHSRGDRALQTNPPGAAEDSDPSPSDMMWVSRDLEVQEELSPVHKGLRVW